MKSGPNEGQLFLSLIFQYYISNTRVGITFYNNILLLNVFIITYNYILLINNVSPKSMLMLLNRNELINSLLLHYYKQ